MVRFSMRRRVAVACIGVAALGIYACSSSGDAAVGGGESNATEGEGLEIHFEKMYLGVRSGPRGSPEASLVLRLLGQRGAEQMPPIATRVVDEVGRGEVERWIVALDSVTAKP